MPNFVLDQRCRETMEAVRFLSFARFWDNISFNKFEQLEAAQPLDLLVLRTLGTTLEPQDCWICCVEVFLEMVG